MVVLVKNLTNKQLSVCLRMARDTGSRPAVVAVLENEAIFRLIEAF